jgi:hypothetical protein
MKLTKMKLTNSIVAAKLYTSEIFMRKRYLMDKKTPEEIAKECGCSLETIYVYLAKFGLRKSRR